MERKGQGWSLGLAGLLAPVTFWLGLFFLVPLLLILAYSFGTSGANHPVLEIRTSRVLVTSQNHGFAVAGDDPAVTHVSLYDGTVEGIALPGDRARSVQFHPEAGPGPHDAWPLLDAWADDLRYAAAA